LVRGVRRDGFVDGKYYAAHMHEVSKVIVEKTQGTVACSSEPAKAHYFLSEPVRYAACVTATRPDHSSAG